MPSTPEGARILRAFLFTLTATDTRPMRGLVSTRLFACGCIAILLLVGFVAPAAGQGHTMRAVRTTTPIVLDGVLDEEAWAVPDPASDFVQAEPKQGDPASERTEVRILFDDDALYVGAWCFDRNPSAIVANSLRVDFAPTEEDTFEVLLDTFADSRGGFLFVTNPRGAKRDVQVSSEGAVQNVDWDAVWDVKTRIEDGGWFVEMRVRKRPLRIEDVTAAPMPLQTSSYWMEAVSSPRHCDRLDREDVSIVLLDGTQDTSGLFGFPITVTTTTPTTAALTTAESPSASREPASLPATEGTGSARAAAIPDDDGTDGPPALRLLLWILALVGLLGGLIASWRSRGREARAADCLERLFEQGATTPGAQGR